MKAQLDYFTQNLDKVNILPKSQSEAIVIVPEEGVHSKVMK